MDGGKREGEVAVLRRPLLPHLTELNYDLGGKGEEFKRLSKKALSSSCVALNFYCFFLRTCFLKHHVFSTKYHPLHRAFYKNKKTTFYLSQLMDLSLK